MRATDLNNILLANHLQLVDLSSILDRHPLGHNAKCASLNDVASLHDQNTQFTRNTSRNWIRLQESGYSEYDIGDAVYHYCRANQSIRAFVLFDLADSIISQVIRFCSRQENLAIVFAKSFSLNSIGAENLISLCYDKKEWFSTKIRRRMARERFSSRPHATLIVFESDTPSVDLKKNLRELLPSRTFSRRIHGTDTHAETLLLVEGLANPNSLDLVNRVMLSAETLPHNRIPEQVRNDCSLCVDGSATLELYGVRQAREVDVLALFPEIAKKQLGFLDINSPNPIDHELIIRDPRFHLVIYGVKYSTLACRLMSLVLEANPEVRPRNPAKVRRDLRLIASTYSERRKASFRLLLVSATLRTRIRQEYERLVTQIIPRLPLGLNTALPKMRKLIRRQG